MCPRFFSMLCGGRFQKSTCPPNSVDLRVVFGKKTYLMSFRCGGTFFPKPCYFVWYIGNNVYICLDLDFWKFSQGFEKNVPPEWNSGKNELIRPAHNIVRVLSLDTLSFLIPAQIGSISFLRGVLDRFWKPDVSTKISVILVFLSKMDGYRGFIILDTFFPKLCFFVVMRIRGRF